MGFGGKNLREYTTWENLGVYCRIILKYIFKSGIGGHGLD
jgi:hypothetical protein